MAFVAKEWSAQSIEIAHRFAHCYEENPDWSLRKLEAATGITYTRLRNIFNVSSAPILLDEFFALCEVFNLTPSSEIELLMQQNGVSGSGSSTISHSNFGTSSDDYDLVANNDENKNNEMYDYYD